MHTRFCAIAVSAFLALTSTAAAEPIKLKVATLAPDSTDWMLNLNVYLDDIEAHSPVPLQFVRYTGGVMGDEPDMVRKLKLGQLHVIAATVAGIAQVVPEMLVLSLPFLFRNYDEVDYVTAALFSTFQQYAAERGYELWGMGDNGFIELYSAEPIRNLDELRHSKLWVWNGNPLEIMFAQALGIGGVPIAVQEVLPGLETGLVNALFTSPTAVVGMQWFARLGHQVNMHVRYEPGGVIARTKAIEAIPAAQRPAFREVLTEMDRKYLLPFKQTIRRVEREMTELMHDQGIAETTWSPEARAELEAAATAVYERATGELFPPELLTKVEALLAEYRSRTGL